MIESVHTIKRFKWFKFKHFLYWMFSPFIAGLGVYSATQLVVDGIPIPFLILFILMIVIPVSIYDAGTVEHPVIVETVLLHANQTREEVA